MPCDARPDRIRTFGLCLREQNGIAAPRYSLTEALENNAQSVSGAIPNPDALAELAAKMQRAKNLALVVGSSIDRDGAFDLAVELAERSGATVWEAPAKSGAVYYC